MKLHQTGVMKWYFALDHYNYSRWLSVHLFDLANLEVDHPDVYVCFTEGFCSFNKRCSEFSNMAFDQVHEQNNDLIKGVGGSLRFLNREDESALLRCELCSSDLAHMIDSFEELIRNSDTSSSTGHKYREDTVSFRNNFVSDVNKLV